MERSDEQSLSPSDQPGPDSPRSSFRSGAWTALIVGFTAGLVYLGAVWLWRPEPARIATFLAQAKANGQQARMWAYYAKLSDEGVTSIDAGPIEDYSTGVLRYTPGEILSFNHFVPRPRPKDALQAAAFDRECAATAAKCRMMQAHYEVLRIKWERAADQWSNDVPPDLPPPLALQPSSNQDITF